MANIPPQARANLPVYYSQGRAITRTKNPKRPNWLDTLRRPLLLVAEEERDVDDFIKSWHFDGCECARILLTNDLARVSVTVPLLVLPGGEDDSMIADFCPVTFWRLKGAPIITIPECAVRAVKADGAWVFAHFPIETNMTAETLIAIAQHRHLDGLNGR